MTDKRRGRDLDDIPATSNEKTKPSDLVELSRLENKKWKRFRLFGDIFTYAGHWVTTKKKDGSKAQFYAICSAFDRSSGQKDHTKRCAWCEHEGEEVRFAIEYYMNAIDRKAQSNLPDKLPKPTKTELATGFKEKDSDTITPVVAHRASTSQIREFKALKGLNVHKDAEGNSVPYGILHARYGCDVSVMVDNDAAPANRYKVQKGDPSPLTKEERSYLCWDLSELQPEVSSEENEKEYSRWHERMFGKSSKKPSRTAHDEDDEDNGDSGFEDEEEKPKSSKRKPKVEDDDDDDEPAPRKGKKKPVVDDDDEDDEPASRKGKKPEAWEDDEDEEPAPRRGKKKPVVDDEDDEDEDDEPAPRKGRKTVVEDDEDDDEPAPRKGKKKPVVDDDDEDDEDDEPAPRKGKKKPVVDDDDDEEPAPRKGKKKPSVDEDEPPAKKPAKGKRKPAEDDDFDD